MNARRSPALDLDRMIGDIYGGFAETGRFEAGVMVVATALQSHITGVRTENVVARRAQFRLFDERGGGFDALVADYQQRWAGKNLWMERSVAGYLSKGYEIGEAVVPDRELKSSEYFGSVLRPRDIRHGAGICLWHDGGNTFSLVGFNRRASVGALDTQEISLVEKVRPHLVNTYRIHRQLALSDQSAGTLRSSFDRTRVGMIVLAEDGRILDANDIAERLMASGIGIARSVDGYARVSVDSGQARWSETLKRVQASGMTGGQEAILLGPAGQAMSRRVVLHLCALPRVADDFLVPGGRVLGFLCPLDRPQIADAECRLLQRILGLTTMEAKVVLLLRGHCDAEEVAQHLHVATSTVRSHIRNVFLKLGIRRQSELVLLAERLLASLPAGG